MSTSVYDSDSTTKRYSAEPPRVTAAASATATAAAVKMLAGDATISSAAACATVADGSGLHSRSYSQNDNAAGVENAATAVAIPLATIQPRPHQTAAQITTSQQRTDADSAGGVVDDHHRDRGTEPVEDLRLLNPQLLAEVQGALNKLENALPNLDAARRTSLIPLVNKLQSCLKVTGDGGDGDETPRPSPSSPQSYGAVVIGTPGQQPLLQSPATLSSSRKLPTTAAAAISSKNRKARHTVGVSREELNDARRWLAVAQNVTDQLEGGSAGDDDYYFDAGGDDDDEYDYENDESTDTGCNNAGKLLPMSPLSQTPMKYESPSNGTGKVYKPVKFTPMPTTSGSGDFRNPAAFPRQHHHQRRRSANGLFSAFDVDDEKLKSDFDSDGDGDRSDRSDVSGAEEEAGENPATSALAASNEAAATRKQAPSRFRRKNNKTTRMKRANTIDVVPTVESIRRDGAPPGAQPSGRETRFSDDETAAASVTAVDRKRTAKVTPIACDVAVVAKPIPPKLQLKTENDKKFAAFLEHTKQDEPHSKTTAYNPSAAGGLQWSSRFSNIKTAFESANSSGSSPLPQPRPSLTPTLAAASASSHFEPIRRVTTATNTAVVAKRPVATFPSATSASLPRQCFSHAQKSPFKPVTKVAPFYTRTPSSPPPAALARNVKVKQAKSANLQTAAAATFADHPAHAPKTYYAPSLASVDAASSTRQCARDNFENDSRNKHVSSPPQTRTKTKKPLTPTVYYAKNDYFLNEPSSYLHGGGVGGLSSSPCSITSPPLTVFHAAAADNDAHSSWNQDGRHFGTAETVPSPWNGLRSVEFSQQRAPVARIMGNAQQSVAFAVEAVAAATATADSEEKIGTPSPTSLQTQTKTIENRVVSSSTIGYSASNTTLVQTDRSTTSTSSMKADADSFNSTSSYSARVNATANPSTINSSRMIKANSVTSPFAKFRQLERQNSLPSSATTTTTSSRRSHNLDVNAALKFADSKLSRSASSIKDRLLNWVKAQTKDYKNVQIDNFSSSWNNGLAFCALIHHFCPHAFDYDKLTPQQRRYNFELAFKVAEQEAGIVPLLDVDDMVIMKRPDWKCVFTYVQTIYQRFHATPEANTP